MQHGTSATPVPISETQYFLKTYTPSGTGAVSSTTAPVASQTVYRNDDGTGGEQTTYTYTWHQDADSNDTNQPASVTTTLPTVGSGENGPGTTDASTAVLDPLGNTAAVIDPSGYVQEDDHDPVTGAVTRDVQDAAPYEANVLADGPLAYYRLGEASGTVAADSSGHGRDGTYGAGATLSAGGALSGDPDASASFAGGSGTTGNVAVPSLTFAGDFSVEAWTRFSSTPSNANTLLGAGGSGAEVNFNGGALSLWSGSSYVAASATAALNTWEHYVITRSGSTVTIYRNGTSVGTGTYSGSLTFSKIGWGNASGNFGGGIDEVALYGRALSSARVAAHYAAGTIARTPLNLVTTIVPDALGRPTKITSPADNVTYVVRNDPARETRTYVGWNATTGTTTGPIQVTRLYYPAANSGGKVYAETLTSSATPAVSGSSGSYVPTGADSLGSSNIQTLSRGIFGDSGQLTETDDYASLSGVTYSQGTLRLGSSGTNYYATTFGYNGQGDAEVTTTPNGTVTFQVEDGQGRPTGTWVGTSATGATPADPTGGGATGNNMLQVEAEQYDGGGVGDSNLTELTDAPGGSAADRVTDNFFDWRDRLVAVKEGAQSTPTETSTSPAVYRPIFYYTLDNRAK